MNISGGTIQCPECGEFITRQEFRLNEGTCKECKLKLRIEVETKAKLDALMKYQAEFSE